MHSSFQKNKFHDHTIRILENRRVGTGGGENIWFPPLVLCNDPGPGSSLNYNRGFSIDIEVIIIIIIILFF